ncbi:MAG TPA: hypothetical protein VEC36_08035 [Patescibacteria group bacterium]|nr:hypothetical protein [Patescibacteria group bacterium]
MKKLVLILLIVLPFSGCDCSTEPSLEERFSCKVDGKLFVVKEESKNWLSGAHSLTIDYYSGGEKPSYFFVIVAHCQNDKIISFSCDSVMNVNTPYKIRSASGFLEDSKDRYGEVNGYFTLSTLEPANLKGTFSFTVKEKGGNKTVTITNGRLNADYKARQN